MTRPILIPRLCGGLGNQLFIYAAAFRLARFHNARLMLDPAIGFVGDPYRRRYALDAFRGPAACPKTPRLLRGVGGRLFRRLLLRFGRLPGCHARVETDERRFDSASMNAPLRGVTYLEGYWQSESYFQDAAPALRQALEPAVSPAPPPAGLASAGAADAAVSLHIRRRWSPNGAPAGPGDRYVTLTVDYYRAALSLVQRERPGCRVVVFGDDPDWARATLNLPADTVWAPPDRPAVDDLLLMARCRHHIIANSSFSWWGAWLGEQPDSLTVAPAAGFVNRDAIPAHWRVLPETGSCAGQGERRP